jgi:hypothetical protein
METSKDLTLKSSPLGFLHPENSGIRLLRNADKYSPLYAA